MRVVIVRPEMFQEVWLAPVTGIDPVAGKALIYGRGELPHRYVAIDDVAALCAHVAVAPDPPSLVEISGPEPLSRLQVVAAFEAATGKPIRVRHVPRFALSVGRRALARIKPEIASLMGMALFADTHASTADDGPLGRAQVVSGAGMLVGSLGGGVIAQASHLGVPYLIRAALLALTFVVAWAVMHDEGFTRSDRRPVQAIRQVVAGAAAVGFGNRPVRWLMVAAPFSAGAGLYVFYALQPFLLDLYGRPDAYAVAGLAASLVAAGQIVGGLLVARISRLLRRRTDGLILLLGCSAGLLVALGLTRSIWRALALVTAWSFASAVAAPLRQSFLNGAIPSSQRATVLSVDSLMGSAGGVVAQPALGRVATAS